MKAQVGDRLVIRGHRIHEPDRDAEIVEVRGLDGDPPFVVRWSDTGHETLIYPGVDARVDHLHRPEAGSDVALLGALARGDGGRPTMTYEQVVELLRRHLDLEHVRTSDYDDELWALWQEEVAHASPNGHNAAVLDRVLARVREGD